MKKMIHYALFSAFMLCSLLQYVNGFNIRPISTGRILGINACRFTITKPSNFFNSIDEPCEEQDDFLIKNGPRERFGSLHGMNSIGIQQQRYLQSLKSIFIGICLSTFTIFNPQHSLADTEVQIATTESTSKPAKYQQIGDRPVGGTNKLRYWDLVQSSDISTVQSANEKLIDYAVGTINTMYYDKSGGAFFYAKDFYDRWKVLKTYARDGVDGVKELSSAKDVSKSQRKELFPNDSDAFIPQLFVVQGDSVQFQRQHRYSDSASVPKVKIPSHGFDSRERSVASLKWLVSTLEDPYSKYLTKDELQKELTVKDDGFLGLGMIVEMKAAESPKSTTERGTSKISSKNNVKQAKGSSTLLASTRVSNLPLVIAIAPDSPAERAGFVVNDRIAAVGSDKFTGLRRDEVFKRLNEVYGGAENYFGHPELTVARPVTRWIVKDSSLLDEDSEVFKKEELLGYKLSRVRLPTVSLEPFKLYTPTVSIGVRPASAATTVTKPFISGGNAIVHWELLTPNNSIFGKVKAGSDEVSLSKNSGSSVSDTDKVGYIRLTRFSRLATSGYLQAIEELEAAGAQSYIIDVRNNYGGIIQESMLTASSLLRDPHTVLCYTLNSRGGFTPHDSEEYIVDTRFPGYLLSSEPREVTFNQVKKDNPDFVGINGESNWVPPSSYASLHEQRMKRNILPATSFSSANRLKAEGSKNQRSMEIKQIRAQKKIAILMNEGKVD